MESLYIGDELNLFRMNGLNIERTKEDRRGLTARKNPIGRTSMSEDEEPPTDKNCYQAGFYRDFLCFTYSWGGVLLSANNRIKNFYSKP